MLQIDLALEDGCRLVIDPSALDVASLFLALRDGVLPQDKPLAENHRHGRVKIFDERNHGRSGQATDR
jgi:hypothetical protein